MKPQVRHGVCGKVVIAIKNTKMQNTLTSSLFKQELHVLEHLAFSVPAYTLSVIHDYTQLQSVTREVIQLLERVTT